MRKMMIVSGKTLAMLLSLFVVMGVLSVAMPTADAPEQVATRSAASTTDAPDNGLREIDEDDVPLAPKEVEEVLTNWQMLLIIIGSGLVFFVSFRLLIRRKSE